MGKLRVLLVEDDPLVRWMAADALADKGYEVLEAETGDEAARLLINQDSIDVIFTDVQMPGAMDGIDLAIRARELYPNIAIIVASGYSPSAVERLLKLKPASVFLQKPYLMADVIGTIRRLCTSCSDAQSNPPD